MSAARDSGACAPRQDRGIRIFPADKNLPGRLGNRNLPGAWRGVSANSSRALSHSRGRATRRNKRFTDDVETQQYLNTFCKPCPPKNLVRRERHCLCFATELLLPFRQRLTPLLVVLLPFCQRLTPLLAALHFITVHAANTDYPQA